MARTLDVVSVFKLSSAKCLHIADGNLKSCSKLQIHQCLGEDDAQSWLIRGNTLVNAPSKLCLDVAGGHFVNGEPAQIYTCNGRPAQSFSLPTGQGTGLGAGCINSAQNQSELSLLIPSLPTPMTWDGVVDCWYRKVPTLCALHHNYETMMSPNVGCVACGKGTWGAMETYTCNFCDKEVLSNYDSQTRAGLKNISTPLGRINTRVQSTVAQQVDPEEHVMV
jgi:hypothetical protein